MVWESKTFLKVKINSLNSDANIKSSLDKTHGFLLWEIPKTGVPSRQMLTWHWKGSTRSSRLIACDASKAASWSLRYFSKVKAASFWYSLIRILAKRQGCVSSLTKWELRLHFDIYEWDSRCYVKTKSASPRQHDLCIYKACVQSLLLQSVQQYIGTNRWLLSLVQSTPTTGSKHRGGPDYVSRHSQWSVLVASKSLTVH